MGKKSAKRVTNFLGTSAMTRPLFMLGAASVLLGAGPANALDSNALPQNPNVVGGKDTFSQSGNTLNVNQSTNRTVIDWRSFDIGSKAQVNFAQPGTSSIAVNRVNASANASQIEGGLHANGQVWILNPNGVFFGKTAHVDAAGIVASTANIDAKAFMAGSNKLQMTGADHGSVENQGNISVGANGLAAFVAPSVRNSGVINATVGRVALAAGTTYTLDLAGDHLVELGLGSVKAVVDNSGKIVNPGGTIALTAKAAGQVVNSVVNVSGVVSASSVSKSGGTITLGGDNVTTTSTAQLSADAGTNGNGGAITSVANVQGNYAGSFSAKGGSASGNGGKIETSGKSVHVDSGITINTLASNGLTGSWTLDPDNLVVQTGGAGSISVNTNNEQPTIDPLTVVAALSTTNVTLQANVSISIESAIDASVNANAHSLTLADQNSDGNLTINLDAPITLKSGGILSGDGSVVNVASTGLIQNGIDVALAGGATVNVAAGTYAPNVNINKSGITLLGASGAEIDVNPGSGQLNAINIGGGTDGVTVSGFKIRGEITGSYLDYAFGSGISRGVAVANGATNFTISNNDIENVRNGILIDGRNTGTVTGNLIDNTKGAISVQYTDAGAGNSEGYAINMSGNTQGAQGNEWGLNIHLNGNYVSGTILSNPYPGGAAPGTVQTALLANSTANSGWTVQDQAYTSSNRTAVTVAATATNANSNPSDANQGSYRSPLATIQAGISAVVSGGTVNVLDGTYTIASGSNYINVTKSLSLIGQSEGGVIIDAHNGTTYGLRVSGPNSNVTLENFTLYGTSTYGLKAEDTTNLTLANITSRGAGKSEFDLNGIINGTLTNLTADGAPISDAMDSTTTAGNGISFTNSQNITLTGSTTRNNAWGGLALYQGTTYGNLQLTGITVDGSNTFTEANGIYAEDQSSVTDIGTVNLSGQGITYIAQDLVAPNDFYTWFRTSQQSAIDTAATVGSGAYVQGYAGNVSGDNTFTVGTSTGGTAMSIQAAVNAAAAGATINVGAGTYTDALNINKNVDLEGAGVGNTIIQPTAMLDSGVGHKYTTDAKVTVLVNGASDVTINGFTINGNDLGNDAVVLWNNSSGSITNSLIENAKTFDGTQTGQGLAVDSSTGYTDNLTVNNVAFQNFNKNAIDAVNGNGGTTVGGNINLTVENSSIVGAGPTSTIAQNGIVTWEKGGGTIDATIDNVSFSALSFNDPAVATATGVLQYGSANGTVTVRNSTFDSSVQEYISTAGGSPNEVDATNGNTFGGVATSSATLDQLFAIQDKITDGTDDSSNGLVRLVAGQVYATAQKNNIQNAVDVASNGDTVNVQAGTYNQGVTLNKSVSLVGESAAGRAEITGGILMSGSLSDITLKNLDVSGTVSGNAADFVIKDSGTLNNFTMDHVKVDGESVAGRLGVGNGQISGAISITNSEFDNISGWVVFDNRAGAGGTPGVNDGTVLTSVNFSNNLVNNSQGDIAFRQLGNGGPYADVTISGNTVENVGSATNSFGGIFKAFNAGTVNFTNNSVSDIGTSGSFVDGTVPLAAALLVRGTSTLNVTDNTFTNDTEAFAVENGKSLPGTVNFSGNIFNNDAYAIYLPTTLSGSGTITFGAGNNIIDGANTVKDIVWTSPSGLDLTNVEFNGVLGSAMTDSQLYATEDMITDGLDNSAYGLARLKAGNVYVTAASGSISNGVAKASAGDTVNVQDGSYTLAGELDITKSLALKGESQNGTIITSNSTGYGINVTADNTSLQNFTFHGPTATGATYGIKVTPDTNVASDRLLNFDIENVTIDRGYRTGLDLNGVLGATIKNVSVSNIVHGNGMALTDSANVTITGSTTSNNAWGGLALYQTNAYYDQQVNNISVDGTNTFNDTIPVYTEDQSASQNFGSISLAGFSYVVQSPNAANDVYSWFQKTKQAAFDFATNAALSNNNVNVPTATVQGYSGSGAYGNNVFYVGTGSNAVALLIGNALNQASTGGTINVDTGTYAEDVAVGKQLSFNFDNATVNSLTVGTAGAGSTIGGNLTATGAIALNGATTVNGNLKAASFASNATLAMTGNLTATGAAAFNGAANVAGNINAGSVSTANTFALTGNLTASGDASLGGASTVKGDISAATFTSNGTLALTGGLTTSGASALNGASNITGNVKAASLSTGNTLALVGDITATNGVTFVGASTVKGNIAAASLTANDTLGLTGNLTTSGASALNGASTITGNVKADSLSTGNTLALVGDIIATNGVTFGGASTVNGNIAAASLTANDTLGLTGNLTTSGASALNGASTITGNVKADSLSTGKTLALVGDIIATHGVKLAGASTVKGNVSAASLTANGMLGMSGNITTSGATALNGASSITGNVKADSLTTGSTLTQVGDIAATNGVTLGGASTVAGNVTAKTFTANGTLALNGGLVASGAAQFNGAATVNGNVQALSIAASNSFGLTGNATASGAIALNGANTLSGNLTAGSIALGATTLTGSTSLNTSGSNGAIQVASVDGGQALAVNAGTGAVSLGNVGATTALASLTDAGATTLTGSTYNAGSFLFGGGVTLTAASTTLNTTQSSGAADNITFNGDIFGTTDGGQSLTLIAGPGTGAASANGDITLQNAGTTAVNLNNLTVSGNNFTALTVDLAGNYNSQLTGNQVFAADTLNVKGNANSNVGGDASGHIVAGGDVTIVANGGVSGTISGQNVNLTGDDVNSVVTAGNTANIQGNTVEGSYTAQTVALAASNNVNAAVNATDFTLSAQHGSVDGTWTTIDTSGSNVVSVNGQTTVGLANVDPNQLVVEGFVLPAGTTIGANGQLILPQGVLLGLLSPGGGKPKMILVHSVQQLGELLASGYSVIVIDLSNKGSGKPIQLASN